jgi:hypothetical protein
MAGHETVGAVPSPGAGSCGNVREAHSVRAALFCQRVWAIPTIGLHHPVQALTFKNDGGRSRAGVSRHYTAPAGLNVVRREGLLVTDRIRTVLDLAAFTPFADAVVPVDHVLRPDRSRRLPALTKAELEAGIGSNYSATAGRRIRAVIEFADPASGSAGESWSRALIHVAGFEAPVLQQEIRDRDGLVAYTDFYWKASRTVGEFDGVALSAGTGPTSQRGSWKACWQRPACPAVVRVLPFSTRKPVRDAHLRWR